VLCVLGMYGMGRSIDHRIDVCCIACGDDD
jgi:hypothetical protein